jgi:hypothetical protein
MPPKKKICRRDSPEIQHPPVTKPLEETVEGKEQTRIHQDKTETSTFHNTHKSVQGSTSESESETERPLDVRGQLEVKKKEADAKEEDDDPEQQESIKSEDDDEEGEYNEDHDDDIYGDDEDDSQTDNSDDIVEYEIDGVSVTRREIREIEEFQEEFHQELFNGDIPWSGFQAPRPTPRRTQPTVLPASHFKCTICGTQAVRRVAGENAMPHNRGRAFYKCPNSAHGQYFKWEDGSAPFSEESQARFNAWMEPLDFDYDY